MIKILAIVGLYLTIATIPFVLLVVWWSIIIHFVVKFW